MKMLVIPTEMRYNTADKMRRAEPVLIVRFVPNAKRYKKITYFRRRIQPNTLRRNPFDSCILQKTKDKVAFAKESFLPSTLQLLSSYRANPGHYLCNNCWYLPFKQDQNLTRQQLLPANNWLKEFSLCQQPETLPEASRFQNNSWHQQGARPIEVKDVSSQTSHKPLIRSRFFRPYHLWKVHRRGQSRLQPSQKGQTFLSSLALFRVTYKRLLAWGLKAWRCLYRTWLRVEFWKECLAKIPCCVYRIRLRADSGFFDHKFIEPLDEGGVGYAIVAKITPAIKRQLGGLRYHKFKKDWGAAEFYYKPWKWENPHRFVVIRRPLPEKDSEQLTLFTMTRYAYQVFVTNLPMKAQNIWYFYRGRATIELIVKELKGDYTLAKIPTNNFRANQAYFYLLLFAYNIVNWFKRTCLPQKFQNATLQTIRTEFLVLPARLIKLGSKNVLKVPAEYISQQTLEQIMHKIEKIKEL